MSATTAPREFAGHPTGLFALFFAEMWERFSYYGMRALLVFYMTKGFLGFDDKHAYTIYGAYASLVYMTPFIGGMIADRILGQRRAVIIGGSLMAAGHLMMTIENTYAFFLALALLITGNGFFKPNISTIVGTLYGAHNKSKRDGGFTIFYMGINLGAAMAPLLCGYIGEKYGWHYGFGLATIGMLIGLAIFVAPTRVTQGLILLGALAGSVTMISSVRNDPIMLLVNTPIAIALIISAFAATTALGRGGLPHDAGAPPKMDGLGRRQGIVLGLTLVAIPVISFLVSNSSLAGGLLVVFGLAAFLYIVVEAFRVQLFERHRLFVSLVMFFFSMLFWAFFEQAGSSMNNFADRNVDRVRESKVVTQADVGQSLTIEVNQEQLGYVLNGKVFTIDRLDALKQEAQRASRTATVSWPVETSHVGMGIGGNEVPASVFQAANPAFVLLFGLVFTMLWGLLGRLGMEPSTPIKFALGLVQLSLGFAVLWWSAQGATPRGMIGASWLVLAYLLHTTGELCLSPVGLSMVTKLSPAHMVSTMMGGWFLATAFSEYLAGLIATLTGVSHTAGEEKIIPPPIETLHVYADVFGRIAIASGIAAVLLFALTPLLKKWIHPELPMTGEEHE
ncbi:MAG: peptide MFS transporter [Deltaproteobacteria bacterium]|nr:peptide MFS transporter [Deltaproteobacteria bacterium]